VFAELYGQVPAPVHGPEMQQTVPSKSGGEQPCSPGEHAPPLGSSQMPVWTSMTQNVTQTVSLLQGL
jgi:hypothetical protein